MKGNFDYSLRKEQIKTDQHYMLNKYVLQMTNAKLRNNESKYKNGWFEVFNKKKN